MMTTLHRHGNGSISYTKGSPDEILKRCDTILSDDRVMPLEPSMRRTIETALHTLSNQALRLLAIAMRTNDRQPQEKSLTFLGLAGMMDPIRPEAVQAVRDFRKAGVRTVMITGDRPDTAFVIARELGIAGDALRLSEWRADRQTVRSGLCAGSGTLFRLCPGIS